MNCKSVEDYLVKTDTPTSIFSWKVSAVKFISIEIFIEIIWIEIHTRTSLSLEVSATLRIIFLIPFTLSLRVSLL